jgi:hypothetical protein
MNVYFHIGTHKTGTTSVQEFSRANAERLLSDGVYIPKTGCITSTSGHHNLAWEITGDIRFNKDFGNFDQLVEEIANCDADKIFVSSEDFEYVLSMRGGLGVIEKRLRRLGCKIVFIIVLREQTEYISSLYYQLQKHGYVDSFDQFSNQILKKKYIEPFPGWIFKFDYFRLISRCFFSRRYFLSIRSYRELKLGRGLIANLFEPILGKKLDHDYPEINLKLNETSSGQMLDMIIQKKIVSRFRLSNIIVNYLFGVKI